MSENTKNNIDDPFIDDPTLADPDADAETDAEENQRFTNSEAQQELICANIIKDEKLLNFAAKNLDPGAFVDKAHKHLVKAAIDLYTDCEAVPSAEWLRSEFIELVAKDKDKASLIERADKILNSVDAKDPAAVKLKTTQMIQRHILVSSVKKMSKGKMTFAEVTEAVAKANNLSSEEESDLRAVTLKELDSRTPDQIPEFLCGTYIAAKHITLVSGREKSGKTTIIHSMIAAIAQGKPWLDRFPTKKVKIAYLDYENPQIYLLNSIKNQCDPKDRDNVLDSIVTVEKLPAALDLASLKQFMQTNKLEDETGILTIDSGSEAFNGLFAGSNRVWTNTAGDVRTALAPLRRIAQETNWAIVLIHHHNKNGQASGSQQWESCVDFCLDVYREEDATQNEMRATKGRWLQQEGWEKPDHIVMQMEDAKLKLIGTTVDIKKQKNQEKLFCTSSIVADAIPLLDSDTEPTLDNTVCMADLESVTQLHRKQIGPLLKELVSSAAVSCLTIKGTGKGKPKTHYYKNNLIQC